MRKALVLPSRFPEAICWEAIPALTVPRKNKIKTFFRLPLIVANELRLSALATVNLDTQEMERNGMHARELYHRADPPSA